MKSTILSAVFAPIFLMDGSNAAEHLVKCRVISVEKGKDTPESFFYHPPGKDEPIQVTPASTIETAAIDLAVPADGTLRFTEGKEASSRVIASTNIQDGIKNAVIFVFPDNTPDDDTLLKIVALEASSKEAKDGGIVLHNLGTHHSRVTLASEETALPPAATLRLKLPESKDDYNMAPLKIEVKDEGVWKPLKDGSIRCSAGQLYWILIAEQTDPQWRPFMKIFKQVAP